MSKSKKPESTMAGNTASTQNTKNTRVAAVCVVLVCAMTGLAFASVPLYRVFCQVTGYGGTTQRADAGTEKPLGRKMTVRFDANVAHGLHWDFRPAQDHLDVRTGENTLAFFKASSMAAKTITGTATFNVTPLAAGRYFNKIDCFCFTEQTLKSGESADMPVTFFVDPEIENDPDLQTVSTITLSYTFFAADKTANVQDTKTRKSGVN